MNEHVRAVDKETARKAWLDAKQVAERLEEATRQAERSATVLWARYIEFDNPRVAEIVRRALKEAGFL